MVAAGIMCQIYSMKGLLRKLSSGGKVMKSNEGKKKKKRKKKEDVPSRSFFCIPSQERVFESTLKCLQQC